jgi:hypothetical protein
MTEPLEEFEGIDAWVDELIGLGTGASDGAKRKILLKIIERRPERAAEAEARLWPVEAEAAREQKVNLEARPEVEAAREQEVISWAPSPELAIKPAEKPAAEEGLRLGRRLKLEPDPVPRLEVELGVAENARRLREELAAKGLEAAAKAGAKETGKALVVVPREDEGLRRLSIQHTRGIPASLENAFIAIGTLGLECSYDVFHDRNIVTAQGFKLDGDVLDNFDNVAKSGSRVDAEIYSLGL